MARMVPVANFLTNLKAINFLTNLKASEVLEKAKELLFTTWGQGRDVLQKHDCECAWTALIYFDPNIKSGADSYLSKAIGLSPPGGGPGVIRWNDAPERTLAEVLDAYTRARELALKDDK